MKKFPLILLALTLAFAPLASLAAAQSYHSECTGGTITHVSGYTIHTFSATTTASFSFTCSEARSVEYLVVAGGGGGGGAINTTDSGGGGGGAGGFRTGSGFAVAAGTYTVVVGAGGAGGVAGAGPVTRGTSGSDSSFSTVTSTGGGGGSGGGGGGAAQSGGSGGGAGGYQSPTIGSGNTPATSPSQGNNGGTSGSRGGGGGGGASAVGQDGQGAVVGGAGGAGTASTISGASVTYAGGGGGGSRSDGTGGAGGAGGGGAGSATSFGSAGTANLGAGGGGGGSNYPTSFFNGGNGGSGIVIIRYLTSYTAYKFTAECTGGTITHANGYTIHTFTSSGTFTCSNNGVVEYLVVAGGGGGGSGYGSAAGGGGGAGGFTTATGYAVTPGTGITVTVGAGGAGGASSPDTIGATGSDSVFGTITAKGGGGGRSGSATTLTGGDGGSGGAAEGAGQPGNGIAGQGNAGGTGIGTGELEAGGGGGAGTAGLSVASAGNRIGANGGAGLASSISGSPVYYAGGGGGAGAAASSIGGFGGIGGGGGGYGVATDRFSNGTANTGGGGGGHGANGSVGGNGGSGIVIVRYVTPAAAPAAAKYKIAGGKYTFQGGVFKFNYTRNTAPSTQTFIENVFSAYTYTNTGDVTNDVTITTGVNLQSKGGLIWGKNRNSTARHSLIDTVKAISSQLDTASALGQDNTNDLVSIGTTGFVVNDVSAAVDTRLNGNGGTYVYWSFAQAPKFFKVTTQVHVNGVANTVDLSSLGTVGMVTVTSTGGTSWYTWHRSLTAGNLVYMNTTAAQTADTSISVSGTTLTLSSALASGTYAIYAWAHDTSSTGLIQCGSYTADGSGNMSVTLGWEPQYLINKRISSAGADWQINDTARGLTSPAANENLYADLSNAGASPSNTYNLTATGFSTTSGVLVSGGTYVYCAIRRGPMQQPGNGLQVYNAVAFTGTGANNKVTTGAGFPPDFVIQSTRSAAGDGHGFNDRLRGVNLFFESNSALAESASSYYVASFNMDGVTDGSTSSSKYDALGQTKVFHFFRRYPGAFDVVAWTGDNTANHRISHNLGVTPELIIQKARGTGNNWWVYYGSKDTYLSLNQTVASATRTSSWGTSAPTSTDFGIDETYLGTNGLTEVAYLFASKPGVSKVGTYTGDGSNGKVINASFASSARFIMIKRTDSTGDWYVWDTVRGITASANDPHLSLNTTTAEVTTDDSIDPYYKGFIVKQNTATNINVLNATYIYLAFQ